MKEMILSLVKTNDLTKLEYRLVDENFMDEVLLRTSECDQQLLYLTIETFCSEKGFTDAIEEAKEIGMHLYYTKFEYKGKVGNAFHFVSDEAVEDPYTNVEEILKNMVLQWAEAEPQD